MIKGLWWKLATGLGMACGIVASFVYVGPTPGFSMSGHGAKMIFFHVPCAWLATVAYLAAAWYSVRYLRERSLEEDRKCAVSMELGMLFATGATITGSIFSYNEWGRYWSWDPRQTSILVILLIFAAYLVLRDALADPEKRARLCSVYALTAMAPGMFLIWVVPRVVSSLHGDANQAVVGGGLSGSYRPVLYGLILPSFIGLFCWLFEMRLRIKRLEDMEQ